MLESCHVTTPAVVEMWVLGPALTFYDSGGRLDRQRCRHLLSTGHSNNLVCLLCRHHISLLHSSLYPGF